MAKKTTTSATPRPRRATTKPAVPAPQPSADDIAQAAYERYLSRGGQHGSDFDDWIEAERELTSRRTR